MKKSGHGYIQDSYSVDGASHRFVGIAELGLPYDYPRRKYYWNRSIEFVTMDFGHVAFFHDTR